MLKYICLKNNIKTMEYTELAKGIIVGFGVLGPALGLGMIFSKALEGISRNPEAS
jgi:F0F1-type ATP synthase membrane subunit c/vacuolar-type H+-ATPase subunit K